jgi:hypothetical protein
MRMEGLLSDPPTLDRQMSPHLSCHRHLLVTRNRFVLQFQVLRLCESENDSVGQWH